MKNLLINVIMIFHLILMIHIDSVAQRISVGSHIEKNIKGVQFGLSTSYNTARLFGVGFFHQMEVSRNSESFGIYKELSGILIDFPIIRDTKLNIIGRLKPSLADRQFFLLIPAVETQVTVFNFLQLAGEVSYRAGYPACSIKTNVVLNLKK